MTGSAGRARTVAVGYKSSILRGGAGGEGRGVALRFVPWRIYAGSFSVCFARLSALGPHLVAKLSQDGGKVDQDSAKMAQDSAKMVQDSAKMAQDSPT